MGKWTLNGRGYRVQLTRVSMTWWFERGVLNPCHVCKGTGKMWNPDMKWKRRKWATSRRYRGKRPRRRRS